MNRRALRALTSSLLSSAADLVTLLGLLRLGTLAAGTATAGGCIAGGVVNFLLSRRWVFDARGGSRAAQLARYAVYLVFGSALVSGLLVEIASARLHAPVLVARGLVAAVVFAAWSYPIASRVVFASKEESP